MNSARLRYCGVTRRTAGSAALILLLPLLVAGTHQLSAQEEMEDVWYPVPEDRRHQSAIVSPATLQQGFLSVGTSMTYSRENDMRYGSLTAGYLPEGGYSHNGYLIESFAPRVSASYGLTDRLQLYASLPFKIGWWESDLTIDYRTSDRTTRALSSYPTLGIGDATVAVDYCFVEETRRVPAFVFQADVKIPTGRRDAKIEENESYDEGETEVQRWVVSLPIGGGEWSASAGLRVRKIIYPFSIDTSFSGRYSFGVTRRVMTQTPIAPVFEDAPVHYQTGPSLIVDLGAAVELNDWVDIANGLSLSQSWEDTVDGEPNGVEVTQLANRLSATVRNGAFRYFGFVSVGYVLNYGGFFLTPSWGLGMGYTL